MSFKFQISVKNKIMLTYILDFLVSLEKLVTYQKLI